MKRGNEILVSLITLVRKEIKRFLRIWVQTLVPPAVTMSLYFVIFGSLIGPRIGTMDGLDYIQFMIPGLIMMSVITNSYANVVSSFYSVKFQKSIEELLVSPMPNWAILVGFIMGGVSRGVLIGFVVFCVSLIFYPSFTIVNPLLTISVLFLTAILFVLFDVEVIFFYPYAVNFKALQLEGLIAVIMFVMFFLIGFFYVLKKGALEWEK
ncbi:MAG: ABC transporter permease [Proteobacteria bacterium]|nr:ABC transporter permease [Pseudomonadota bacterium]